MSRQSSRCVTPGVLTDYGGEPEQTEHLSLGTPYEAWQDYNRGIMTSNLESPTISEVCEHVKDLGYAVSERVRLYGEEFEVVSDPFPEADGIAVQVTSRKDSKVRVLQLPATVVQSAKRQRKVA